MSKTVKNLAINLQAGTDTTVYMSWDISSTLEHLDHYHVQWYYTTGNGINFDGGSDDISTGGAAGRRAVYTPPSNAISAHGKVKPVSKTYKKNDKDVSYWTGAYKTSARYDFRTDKPPAPSVPSVEVDQYTMTATIDNITDASTDQIEFQVVQGTSTYKTGTSTKKTNRCTFSCDLKSGYKYRVRARAINLKSGTAEKYWTSSESSLTGPYSDYSDEFYPVPPNPTNISCAASGEEGTEVKVTWTGNSSADNYTVEYATNKNYFDSGGDVQSQTVDSTTAFITGLETGKEWFFRVKATNGQGDSGFSSVVSCVIGTKPNAPTTWSSRTKVMVGDSVMLYWTHNTQDGSDQSSAEIELTINGSTETIPINEDMQEYELSLSGYVDGTTIFWRVRTAGITKEYSDWSIQRSIDVYAPPTLSIDLNLENDTLYNFPLVIDMQAGPDSQTAITYFVSITALRAYETVDYAGRTVMIDAGEEVFSKNFNFSYNDATLTLSAGDLDLAAGQAYRVYVVVSMNSGLSTDAFATFEVNWGDADYDPDAGLGFDEQSYTMYVNPYCEDEDTGELLENEVVLSVYRREYDGALTLIADEIPNDGSYCVTDPHPSLDYARYRIVARGVDTSIVGFTDLPGYPVQADSIVIQWDEDWIEFDTTEEDPMEEPAWSGSMVVLPGNVDISEQVDKDVSLVEYIGREHPVSYYGTQKGEGGSWSCEIPKKDNEEMIYNLRRLSAYTGDVYVREPSGIGYWAQISVDMSQTHCETVIPVSFEVKRVEGGEA